MTETAQFDDPRNWLIDEPGSGAPIDVQRQFIADMRAQFGPDANITREAEDDLAFRLANPLPGDPGWPDHIREVYARGELQLTPPGPDAPIPRQECFIDACREYIGFGMDFSAELAAAERDLAWRRAHPQPGDLDPR